MTYHMQENPIHRANQAIFRNRVPSQTEREAFDCAAGIPGLQANTGDEEKVIASLDDGFMRLPNLLQDYLCSVDITRRQQRVLNAIARKTYGFNKDMDWITSKQIKEMMDYEGDYRSICADLRELKARKIILEEGKKIGVNPVLSDWQMRSVKPKKTQKNAIEDGDSASARGQVNGSREVKNEQIDEFLAQDLTADSQNKTKENWDFDDDQTANGEQNDGFLLQNQTNSGSSLADFSSSKYTDQIHTSANNIDQIEQHTTDRIDVKYIISVGGSYGWMPNSANIRPEPTSTVKPAEPGETTVTIASGISTGNSNIVLKTTNTSVRPNSSQFATVDNFSENEQKAPENKSNTMFNNESMCVKTHTSCVRKHTPRCAKTHTTKDTLQKKIKDKGVYTDTPVVTERNSAREAIPEQATKCSSRDVNFNPGAVIKFLRRQEQSFSRHRGDSGQPAPTRRFVAHGLAVTLAAAVACFASSTTIAQVTDGLFPPDPFVHVKKNTRS